MPRIVPPATEPPHLEDIVADWLERYGEAINYHKAASLIGCDPSTICRMVQARTLPTTPQKRVLVRPLAEWAYRDYCTSRQRKRKTTLGGMMNATCRS